MKLPVWTKPALWGAALGAVALGVIGFSWGGWLTRGNANEMARQQTVAAIAEVLTPYCLERSKTDANSVAVLAELDTTAAFGKRAVVEKAGWATPLGAERPNRELAQACMTALTAATP